MAHTCFLHAGVRRQTCGATRRGVFVAKRCALPAVGPVCCRDVEDLAPRLLLFVLGGRSGQNQLRRSAGEGCAGERFECMRKCSCAKYRGFPPFFVSSYQAYAEKASEIADTVAVLTALSKESAGLLEKIDAHCG